MKGETIMKKIVLLTLAICLCLSLLGCARVEVAKGENGTAQFIYGEKRINTEISSEDVALIAQIFEGKKLYSAEPSCGFTENVSVIIDGQTFCVANDDCAIIYLKEKNKYFDISDEENIRLREVLESYGFSFPCV